MGFKISTATSYEWQVSGKIATEYFSFTAEFLFLPQSRIDELLLASNRRAALLSRGEDDPELANVSARAIADEVLVGWSGITDDDGVVEYSAAKKQQLLQMQGVAGVIADAWGESLGGARVKNSKGPRGIG